MHLRLSDLWGRITGKDKRLKYPDQQASMLGRVGDHTIVFPYGLYCDLPDDVLLKSIADGVAISVTVARPDDAARGEPVFFHPVTGTRVIMRNNGDLDGIVDGNINATCKTANVTATESVNIDSPLVTMTGDLRVKGNITARFGTGNDVGVGTHKHSQGSDSDGDTQQDTNSPTAGS